jgi:intracellular sulfur oxidation DsrE/DsrF family protein
MDKRYLAVFGLLALLASAPAAAQKVGAGTTAGSKPATQNRMVFQVNEDDSRKWHTVLANLNNVQEELGKVDISVVVIGPGLGMLKADALTANGVQDAMAAGVRFVACGNSIAVDETDQGRHDRRHRLCSGRLCRNHAPAEARPCLYPAPSVKYSL